MSALKVAVVGVGSLGQHHARIAAGSEQAELVAVVDPSEARGREIAEKFGTRWVAGLDDPSTHSDIRRHGQSLLDRA